MKRKGISLPIEMIVIIAVAVLVLVVIAAFFAGGFGGGSESISANAALVKGCSTWKIRSADCSADMSTINIPGYNPTGIDSLKTKGDTLKTACTSLGYTLADCKIACGCPSA